MFTLFDSFQGSCEHDSMLRNNRLRVCVCVGNGRDVDREKTLMKRPSYKEQLNTSARLTASQHCPVDVPGPKWQVQVTLQLCLFTLDKVGFERIC